jgi:hypothetical protein
MVEERKREGEKERRLIAEHNGIVVAYNRYFCIVSPFSSHLHISPNSSLSSLHPFILFLFPYLTDCL